MAIEELALFGVPLAAFAVAAFVAHAVGRARNGTMLGVLGLLWAGVTGALWIGMEQASGWDGISYAIGLLFLCAPAGGGLTLGGVVGWLRGEPGARA